MLAVLRFTILIVGLSTSSLFAEEVGGADKLPFAGSRKQMQDHLKEQQVKEESLFASSPVYHVIPKSKTVLLGGNIEQINLNLTTSGTSISDGNFSEATELITMTGWTAEPIVAVSAKNFGMAASAEVGERHVYYRQIDSLASPSSVVYEEESLATFSGIGLYIYWLPSWKWLPKSVSPSFTFGRRKLNVVHKNKAHNPEFEQEFTKYRYNVRKDDYGFNVGIRLVKKVVILPWYNYTHHIIDQAETEFVDGEPSSLVADKELIWRHKPSTSYGIDINVKISKLNLGVGGFLGLIGGLNAHSDQIYDRSFAISASWDFKSK